MSKLINISQWCNGNRISVSIDDNLNNTFRGDVVVFHSENNFKDNTEIGFSRSLEKLAKDILTAVDLADKQKGTVEPFSINIRN
jgi:hypothetical protein